MSDASSAAATLERVKVMLDKESVATWDVFNVLAFMVEALPGDKRDDLPVRSTLVNLREQTEKLATALMDLVLHAARDNREASNV